ncbi:MAG TPA: Gfo/Idh/MocA family oxidoreductase [Terriglobales bacterium]|jgi:predicted dehydrogenase|nr:Gfo/Idh/MocA family oxidoreductase [Terriglobales bacterium]
MIRVGLIGCGEHSEIGHAVPLARYKAEHPEHLELTAACDLRKERAEYFCKTYGFRRSYADVSTMLSSEQLNLCIAVVPVDKISALGIELLQRGTACVVEKPLGATFVEATALRDRARLTRTANMVSVNRRFMPWLNNAIQWARSIGEVRYVRAVMSRDARTEPEFFWETAVHSVDALRHIAGNIKQASFRRMPHATGVNWYGMDIEFDENGVFGRVDVLPTSGVLEETYEICGEGFRAIVTCPFGPERTLRCYQQGRLVLRETDKNIPEDVVFGFYDEARSAIRNLLEKDLLSPTIEDVYPSVEMCFSAKQNHLLSEFAAQHS